MSANLCNHYRNQGGNFSGSSDRSTSSKPLSDIYLKDSISYYIDIYPFMFVTAVFIIEIENILDLCK